MPGDSSGPLLYKYKKYKPKMNTDQKPEDKSQPEAKIDTSSNFQPSTSQEQNKQPQEEAQQEKVVKQNPSEEEWEWDYKLVGITHGKIEPEVFCNVLTNIEEKEKLKLEFKQHEITTELSIFKYFHRDSVDWIKLVIASNTENKKSKTIPPKELPKKTLPPVKENEY